LSKPSAPQKRFWAKGKSLEMHKTFVFFIVDADLLKDLTEVAQVPVSTLGKIFKSNVDP
jgi:hypothetical protein